ncbi:MAG: acylneuraminate cytidylyltransferase family protein [Acidobacteriota bacterium]
MVSNTNTTRVVALIPARMGSKRVPGKNIRVLGGHPMVAYTIAPAIESGIFDTVIVSTDSDEVAEIARHYGAEVPFLRPAEMAGDTSPDIEWVEYTLGRLRDEGRAFDAFSLLRPTSPFRTPETLRRAWQTFIGSPGVDSLRAVEKCTQHPGKMWVIRGQRLLPLLPFGPEEQPWHSSQYQSLPLVYVQNASLEIAWSRIVFQGRTIAGETLVPFLTDEMEGFDINDKFDWLLAEHLLESGAARLPHVPQVPWQRADS